VHAVIQIFGTNGKIKRVFKCVVLKCNSQKFHPTAAPFQSERQIMLISHHGNFHFQFIHRWWKAIITANLFLECSSNSTFRCDYFLRSITFRVYLLTRELLLFALFMAFALNWFLSSSALSHRSFRFPFIRHEWAVCVCYVPFQMAGSVSLSLLCKQMM
jgi:hypothetical protein